MLEIEKNFFLGNVLEKSYQRPKIFTILIVPAIQFYDMMHSINCEKNVNIAFNMLCRIGRQTTNLPENVFPSLRTRKNSLRDFMRIWRLNRIISNVDT